jgi:hypothetical protein
MLDLPSDDDGLHLATQSGGQQCQGRQILHTASAGHDTLRPSIMHGM